tara:strand:+ start:2951 stop:3133 length:183 start_codon:yes stop_codon:yes gene_type:complete
MKHLKETGMSYTQHMRHALFVSALLFIAAFCCLAHSVAPFMCESTASDIIKHLNKDILKR